MDYNDFKEHILTEGLLTFNNFYNQNEVNNIRSLAQSSKPIKGSALDGRWYHSYYKPDEWEDNINWAHYWTDQNKHEPVIQHTIAKVEPIINSILGNDWTLWCSDYHVTCSGSKYIQPHIDNPYGHLPWELEMGLVSLQMLIAVDDFTIDNGGTAYVPRSHTMQFDLNTNSLDLTNYLLLHNTQFTGKAGSMIVYHPRTLHTTMPNNSPDTRHALLFSAVKNEIIDQLKHYDRDCTAFEGTEGIVFKERIKEVGWEKALEERLE